MGLDEEPPQRGSGIGPGDLVAGQYEILRLLARGAFGLIYLARDRNLDGKQVVLKGLTRPYDTAAIKLATTESRTLIALEHSNIVRIFAIVTHPDPGSGEDRRYIVMDYVHGLSLRQACDAGGLSAEQVIGYGVEILSALQYLHGRGLLYCDMKPENVIHFEQRVKLIDFGAIRRIDDRESPVLGTPPYQVSGTEIREHGLTVRSDIYAVGMTLAELLDTDGPDSLRHVLDRATADFDHRFATVTEMLEQLEGVEREILSLRDREPRPALSAVFAESAALLDGGLGQPPPLSRWMTGTRDGRAAAILPDGRPEPFDVALGLPIPYEDPEDPETPLLRRVRAPDAPRLLKKLAGSTAGSVEIEFRQARVHLELHELDATARCLAGAERLLGWRSHFDWRTHWHRGLLALAEERVGDAERLFAEVYRSIPGEDAPKLALGFCAEYLDRPDIAARYYEPVWVRDRSQVGAAFGLARISLAEGDRQDAVEILDQVSEVSLHQHAAAVAAVRILAGRLPDGLPSADELTLAVARLWDLHLDSEESWERLAAAVRETALDWVRSGRTETLPGSRILGEPVTEKELRSRLEESYRRLARRARTAEEHGVLIDRANGIRPRSLW